MNVKGEWETAVVAECLWLGGGAVCEGQLEHRPSRLRDLHGSRPLEGRRRCGVGLAP